jgi:hypothetical protein
MLWRPGLFLNASLIAISTAKLPCKQYPIRFRSPGEISRSFAVSTNSGTVLKLSLACVISRSCAIAASTTRGSPAPRLFDQACDVQSRYSRPLSSHTNEPLARTRVIFEASPPSGSCTRDCLPRAITASRWGIFDALVFMRVQPLVCLRLVAAFKLVTFLVRLHLWWTFALVWPRLFVFRTFATRTINETINRPRL